MTADSETITIPFSFTDDDLREFRNRWLKRQLRTLPFLVGFAGYGLVVPGKAGGVMLGFALYLVVFTIGMYRRFRKNVQLLFRGVLANQRLVLSEGRASLHSAAGLTLLSAGTVKKIVEGDRLVYLDTPWEGWQPIPRRIAQQQGVWARLVEATKREAPTLDVDDVESWGAAEDL